MENINYTPKDILQKEFRQKMRGYDPNDVDSFLDNIIKDYEAFNKQLQELSDENDRLKVQVNELNKQLAVSGNQPMPTTGAANPTPSRQTASRCPVQRTWTFLNACQTWNDGYSDRNLIVAQMSRIGCS